MGDGTLNGQLLYVFLIAILDAAILSFVALRWYRRAVSHRMRGETDAAHDLRRTEDEPIEARVPSRSADPTLQIAVFRAGEAAGRVAGGREWPEGARRIAAAYCVGAALFSAVITTATAVEMSLFRPAALFAVWWMNTWAVVPTLILLLLLDRRAAARLVVVYLLGGSAALVALTVAVQAWQGSVDTAPFTNAFWVNVGILATAWLPLLLLVFSGWHRIRSVMPLALASTIFFGFGLLLFREAIVALFNAPGARDILLELAAVTSTQVAYYSLYMLVALPAGWLAWRFLRRLAQSFERKHFSDIQLVIDCWWLIVTAETTVTHLVTPFGVVGLGIGIAAFAAYRVGTYAILTRLAPAPAAHPTRLLLLRVFGHQARTETLFDRIAQRWRFRGPVQLIAGVDLAMRTADPGDMLAFVSGRLRDVYVSTATELPARLARLDMAPDPDGRFRVNDVYCTNATWQHALQQLLALTDVVLMDLRGFSRTHRGVVWELGQLVTHLPIDSIIMVCDRTTDLAELATLLDHAWSNANRGGATGPMSLVRVDGNSPRELDTLMERLRGRGTPETVVPLAELPGLA